MKTKKERNRLKRNQIKKMRDRLDIRNVTNENDEFVRSSFVETAMIHQKNQPKTLKKTSFGPNVRINVKGRKIISYVGDGSIVKKEMLTLIPQIM